MLVGAIARLRSFWRAAASPARLDREMDEEMRAHVELRADHLRQQGLSAADASRQARIEFGSPELHRDRGRESHGVALLDRIGVSWVDFRLGARMLVKYPGLTIIGGLAMAVAIGIGAATFAFINQLLYPVVPLPEGERIVVMRLWDAAAGRPEARITSELAAWRSMKSVEDVGAYRTFDHNLFTGAGDDGGPVSGVEISAATFRIARVPVAIGRPLLDADERPGAPPVIVIGHDIWTTRFGADSSVIGREVRLGRSRATVIGVMPAGFRYPLFHSAWMPLRLAPAARIVDGPAVSRVVARLAPGRSIDDARAELASITARRASQDSVRYAALRPQVLSYPRSFLDLSTVMSAGVVSSNLFLVLLVVLVGGNVALLMFARAAAREGEIVVRSALGASRRRIVMQLFAEALVLSSLAALVGIGAAAYALRWGLEAITGIEGPLPFWVRPTLAPSTVLYAAALAVVAAAIAGVLPALRVTRAIEQRLRQVGSGGHGVRFGGVWTAVIVIQVAATLVFPVSAYSVILEQRAVRGSDTGIRTSEFATMRLSFDREAAGVDSADATARFRNAQIALTDRLLAEPGVRSVTYTDALPGLPAPARRIGIERLSASDSSPQRRVQLSSVAPDFFEVLGARPLAGRSFSSSDVAEGANTAIVNRAFAQAMLAGGNPVGRRFRYVDEDRRQPQSGLPGMGIEAPGLARSRASEEQGAWHSIVGVIADMGTASPRVYHAVGQGTVSPVTLLVRVEREAAPMVGRLRAMVDEGDVVLRGGAVSTLDRVTDGELRWLDYLFRIAIIVSAMALVLSLAGIYAVMSFTVATRTREIGVRMALGADSLRIVTAIFRRPLTQLTGGVLAGAAVVTGITIVGTETMTAGTAALVVAYVALMFGICLLACAVPTRRALRVPPADALRSDG